MTERYKVLGAMLSLREFTVADLSVFSGVKQTTIRTVLSRGAELLTEIGKEPNQSRGGQFTRYRLREDKVDGLRSELHQLHRQLGLYVNGEISNGGSGEYLPPLQIVAGLDALLLRFPGLTDSNAKIELIKFARAVKVEQSLQDQAGARGELLELYLLSLQALIDLSSAELASVERPSLTGYLLPILRDFFLSLLERGLRLGQPTLCSTLLRRFLTSPLLGLVTLPRVALNKETSLLSVLQSQSDPRAAEMIFITQHGYQYRQETSPQKPASYRVLEHSYRRPRAGARRTRATDPNEVFTVSVRVRRAPNAGPLPDIADLAATPQGHRQYLSREDFAAKYGASPADLTAVAQFATDSGLQVIESSTPRRTVVLKGTAAQMGEAFQVELGTYETAEETYRGREGSIQVPAPLVNIVEGIFGLDNRKMAAPQLKVNGSQASQASPAQATVPLTPPQVAQLYNFPTSPNAAGQTIGILGFGGGYLLSDVQLFYNSVHVPIPSITAVSIDGQKNSPGSDGYTTETLLDVGVAGSAAPGAKLVVYFAPWSEQGWVDAVTTAIHDTVNHPSVITISYGWPENETNDGLSWSLAAIRAVNATFQEAALLGVTVFVSAGNHGSDCGIGDSKAHVLYPGSDPFITSCGGTSISNVSGLSFTEHTWNDNDNDGATGGGASDIFYPPNFPLPVWQAWAGVPGSANDGHKARTIPDIAGNADGASGYVLFQNGQSIGAVGGTSATAPLYAALTALLNAGLGEPVGYLNPNLYAMPYTYVYRDINDGISNARGGAPGYKIRSGIRRLYRSRQRQRGCARECTPWSWPSCRPGNFQQQAVHGLEGHGARRPCLFQQLQRHFLGSAGSRYQTFFRAAACHLPSMPASSTWPGRACWATQVSITRTSMELPGRRSNL